MPASSAQPFTPSFDLTSHWQIAAPVEKVWDALRDTESWPTWWSYAREVRCVKQGAPDGLGRVMFIRWSTRLPYEIAFEVEAVEIVPLRKLRGRSRGELNGEGTWLLEPDGTGTKVTYVWQVDLGKPWMRLAAPLLAGVFRWNHNGLMAAGEAGLKHHLQKSN